MDLQALKQQFETHYPESGTPFLCRVPGRVNLMGEHLDYNGLPVLPVAIDRALYVAFSPVSTPIVRLANMDARFSRVEFENASEIESSPAGDWDNYAKAAIAGLNQCLAVDSFKGLDVLVGGDLPRGAGLSSSSALVVGVGMAYLAALDRTLDRDISRLELAAILAEAEHYVGTAGGGMDQTAILTGEEGYATRINFIPFQTEHVPLPAGTAVLVCDSLVETSKSGAMLTQYNAGPAVCSLITALVEARLKGDFGDEFAIDCLGDLWYGPLCFNRREVRELFDAVFDTPYMAPSEISNRLGMTEKDVCESWLNFLPADTRGYPLQARARHVFSEYYRVEDGRDALIAGDPVTFGRFMNESHESCALDYGVSTPELDALCGILNDAGSHGARLTGAGFGGAVVALAPEGKVAGVIDAVSRGYYADRLSGNAPVPAFPIRASGGACYIS